MKFSLMHCLLLRTAALLLLFLSPLSLCSQMAADQAAAAKKFIYLTFDDGPLDGSEKIADAVAYEKVPITVLLVGRHAESKPDYLKLYKENDLGDGRHLYAHELRSGSPHLVRADERQGPEHV